LVGGQVDGLGDSLDDDSLAVALVERLVDLGEFALALELLLNAVFLLWTVAVAGVLF